MNLDDLDIESATQALGELSVLRGRTFSNKNEAKELFGTVLADNINAIKAALEFYIRERNEKR